MTNSCALTNTVCDYENLILIDPIYVQFKFNDMSQSYLVKTINYHVVTCNAEIKC